VFSFSASSKVGKLGSLDNKGTPSALSVGHAQQRPLQAKDVRS
jgi:hypothetical protein